MRRALGILLLCACGELGVTVDVSAKPDVPKLDALRVQVVQGSLLAEQTFMLGSQSLPQSVAIVSKGLTRGSVEVTVQGLAAGRVEAVGLATGELKPATWALRVSALLERVCNNGEPTCGCNPATCGPGLCGRLDDRCGGARACGGCGEGVECGSDNRCATVTCRAKSCAELGAACGLTLDGCGRTIDCGQCDAGSSCGGAGVANRCGPGSCVPRARCDAGLECGSQSDGCGSVIACGSCDAGVCGANQRCPCVPATWCPAGMQCGPWPNGCGTGMLDCGACTLPQTCGGGGQANQCGCMPNTTCAPLACGQQLDGCGGTFTCPINCTAGRACSAFDGGSQRCECTGGLSDCNGACVDLLTSAGNCGACGRNCPGGQSCHGGLCPCVDAGSNADGHCCPAGWALSAYPGGTHLLCFRGPFDAGTESAALAVCLDETDAGFGRAVSALGTGASQLDETAVPDDVCGTYLLGNSNDVVVAYGTSVNRRTTCGGSTVCPTSCSCPLTTYACAQRFYCVMDPLGPVVEGACNRPSECPPGMTCRNGNCSDAGVPFCVVDADCPRSGTFGNCQPRNGAQTGLCN